MGRKTKQHRLRRPINYFLKLTQPSSVLGVARAWHYRGHFTEVDGQPVIVKESAHHGETACSAERFHVSDSMTVSRGPLA
jgi:hypothetical protein